MRIVSPAPANAAQSTDSPQATPLGGDFLGFHTYLSEGERRALARIRAYLEIDVAPYADGLWERGEFPHRIIHPLADLNTYSFAYPETRPFENSAVFRGMLSLELARVDASVSTFACVHAGLAMGSIALCGSDEQRANWLPKMASGEVVGCFALTEPAHGSDVAGGLETTARRQGDEWVLNGSKRWIGNGTWADVAVVWARNEEDGRVLGFLVPTETRGYSASKIEGKYSQRIVQNADIVLKNLHLPESLRLQRANGFGDTAKVLSLTRLEVAFSAIGNAMGAYEKALAYAVNRKQFGKTITEFQMVQDLLVKALSNITSALSLAVSVARMHDEGRQRDEHSSMAKLVVLNQCREAVGWCREALGGNGIVIDYGVMRHFADAEAQYSFEGTREVNTLIVGRAITGKPAFV
jgi:glutaryl-CoA dehydrogenase